MSPRRDVAILFDGSIEGFLCIVHAYYYESVAPLIIQIEDCHQPTLDTEEYHIITDENLAAKVQKGILNKISHTAWHYVISAFLADGEDKYMAIFRYLLLGFKTGKIVDDHLQQECVLRVHKLARQVGREAHLLKGFCRFVETTAISDGNSHSRAENHKRTNLFLATDQTDLSGNGYSGQIYYCAIDPVNYVLPILAEHFSDRMMNQAWIIHDKKHGKAAVYNGETYVIADVPKNAQVRHTENEAEIQDLWVTFFNSLAIKERINPKLQRNLLPLHFRKSMTEFQR